jgi:hypothetical protein
LNQSGQTALAVQGCQIFLGANYQNWKYIPKWPQNIPNRRKTDQMAIKFTQHLSLKGAPKFIIIWIFCLKIYHLATVRTSTKLEDLSEQGDQMSTLKEYSPFLRTVAILPTVVPLMYNRHLRIYVLWFRRFGNL